MPKNLHACGSTECPAYLELLNLGYEITCDREWPGGPMWFATNDSWNLSADSLATVLGLHFIQERRGMNWHASDDEITSFINKYRT